MKAMKSVSWLRLLLVALTLLVVQDTLIMEIHLGSVHPDVMVLLPIGSALLVSSEVGGIVGLATGLMVDLFASTPFGLTALCYVLLGYAAGYLPRGIWLRSKFLVVLTASLGSFLGEILYAVLAGLLGESGMTKEHLLKVATVVGVGNMILAVPVVWLISWAIGHGQEGLLGLADQS